VSPNRVAVPDRHIGSNTVELERMAREITR
jgi:hypothetical protein